jgi:hypothetical protein
VIEIMDLNDTARVAEQSKANGALLLGCSNRNPDQEFTSCELCGEAVDMGRQYPLLQSGLQTVRTSNSSRRQQSMNDTSGTAYRFSLKEKQFIQTVRLLLGSDVSWPMSTGPHQTYGGQIHWQRIA